MTSQEFLNALEEALGVSAGSLTPGATLDSLGCWDSMATLVFMSLADQKFNLTISGANIQKCKTVDDLVGLLGKNIAS